MAPTVGGGMYFGFKLEMKRKEFKGEMVVIQGGVIWELIPIETVRIWAENGALVCSQFGHGVEERERKGLGKKMMGGAHM